MKIIWSGPPQQHLGLKLDLRAGKAYEVPDAIGAGWLGQGVAIVPEVEATESAPTITKKKQSA